MSIINVLTCKKLNKGTWTEKCRKKKRSESRRKKKSQMREHIKMCFPSMKNWGQESPSKHRGATLYQSPRTNNTSFECPYRDYKKDSWESFVNLVCMLSVKVS